MECAKKYAPRLYRNVMVVSMVLCILGGFVLLISVLTEENDSLTFGVICLSVGLLLIADLYFASLFFSIAVDKGYTQEKYIMIAFVFTFVGYLLIIAMPDRGVAHSFAINSSNNLTVSKNNETSTSKTAPQSYDDYSTHTVPKGCWTCTCGKVNASYVSSCSCGTNKRDVK